MSTHKSNMSALINLSASPNTTCGYPITTRANQTARRAFQRLPVRVPVPAEARRVDKAIWKNLEELGYGR